MSDPDLFYAGIHRTQFDGSPGASEACVPTSGANGARASSGGKVDDSGGQVHALVPKSQETDPHTAGWSLEDLDRAMGKLGVGFEIRHGTFVDVLVALDAGHIVALQGDSDQFPNGTCSGVFNGNHCVAVHPGRYSDGSRLLADPICKQRRPETEAVLKHYVEKFAGGTAIRFGLFTTPVPLLANPPAATPQESKVKVTATVYQEWTAQPTHGVLRATPDRAAPITATLPAGTVVVSRAEAEDPHGNHWRLVAWPAGSRTVGWLLRFGPGVPADHDFKAGAFVAGP